MSTLTQLQEKVIRCRLCPRLVEHRERVAREKRAAFRDWTYWGRPVPSFGSCEAQLLILGLAPAAHGANRTGRMFTGDRSGDFLYQTLYRFGFCTQPESRQVGDDLVLNNAYISAAIRCAPPGNKPLKEELENCRPYLVREIELLTNLRVIVALGRIAWDTCWRARQELGRAASRPRPLFAHGTVQELDDMSVIASYHPSQQNTQTGRLTREMFDSVFAKARELLTR